MSSVRDSDTSLWLHNKLGTNDLWSSHSICSQLNRELLRKIPQIFPDLQSQVKLKLILAILHIPLRNMVEWSQELKSILIKASQDTDPWVAMLSDLLRTYPDDGTLFLDPESGGFCELLNELRKLVRSRGSEQVLPEECLYLNKSASNALLGQPAIPTKHFNVKKNPKSYQVKHEYLQKAREAQNTKRTVSSLSSVPIRCRGYSKLSADSPLRGLPSNRLSGGSFRSPISSLNHRSNLPLSKTPNRKESGIKLLEIGEQPIGRDAKRRRKGGDEEVLPTGVKAGVGKEDKKEEAAPGTDEETPVTTPTTPTTPATPDYAAGLLSSSMAAPSPAAPATPAYGAIPSISKVPAAPAASKTPVHTPQYAQVSGTPSTPTTPQTPPSSVQPQAGNGNPTSKFTATTQLVVSPNQIVENRPSYAASTLVSNSLLQTASQASYGLRTQSGDSSPTTQQNSVNSGSSGTQAVLLQTGQTFTVQQTSQQSTIQQQLPQQQTSYASPQTVQTVTQVGQQLSGQQVTYVQTASGALQSVHTSPVIQQRITTQQIANTNSASFISTGGYGQSHVVVNQATAGGTTTAASTTGQLVQGANGTQYVIRQAVQGPQLVQTGNVQQLHVGVQQLQQLGVGVGHLQQQQVTTGLQQTTQQLVQTTQPGVQQQAQQQSNGSRVQQQRLVIRTPTVVQQQTTQQATIVPYSISQTQFNEAQEMFKNSNKVTRSEKALILGFIAGNRQNPCPTLGDVITIVLNEDRQVVQQADGSLRAMLVQTHFEMNYATGEWATVIRQFPEGQSRTPSHVITTTTAASR
ncbi:negative elongation factor A-like isoform X2 [Varroa jacobsoni]|nr:negative elongation factor A-like isoform X2 [Varroa destructor]XP_022701376.1 negative elongation factor A-like isoform X2 [Varroa jacobsoni]